MEQYKTLQQTGQAGSESLQCALQEYVERLEMDNNDLAEQLKSWQVLCIGKYVF